jgi:hypothetical protein
MKIWDVDILQLFNFFWSDKNRNKSILFWCFFGAINMVFMIVSILVGLFGSRFVHDPETLMMIFGLIYILYFLISTILGIFNVGIGLTTYDQIKKGKIDLDLFNDTWYKFKQGTKIFIINLYYSIPFLFIFLVFGFILFMIYEIFGDVSFFFLFCCGYGLFFLILIIYSIVINYIIRPICIRIIQSRKFSDVFNINLVLYEIQKNKNNLIRFAVISLLVGILWTIVYFVAYYLIYLVIGVLILPFVFAFLYIYTAYIEPKLINIIFDQPKS